MISIDFVFGITESENFYFEKSNLRDEQRIHFLQGAELNQQRYSDMLKLFMSGGQIILNTAKMPDDFRRKLELFLIENDLKVEKVNFNCLISNVQLDLGRLLIFNSNDLACKPSEVKKEFWERLISTFSILHLHLEIPSEIQVLWKTRNISTSELKFEEVRRLSLYNLSSYKKKIKIPQTKNFALLKILDEINVNVSNLGQELLIEFLPDSHVSLDFGVYT